MPEPRKKEAPPIFRVKTASSPPKVAGAIAGIIREHGRCELQAIGAGAVNQTVKAIGIARGYLAPAGMDIIAIPGFLDLDLDGEERTAIRFVVEPR